ncbi:MAG: crossover junction endodeoxyribonuclease RuvC [Candidatus Berkelbacteria bacterium]|nr:MAG: crossover junction endodeoxyribonuclease RuvC [Candidatus Berkelbacteria bacterium]QQG51915.1 MAG: crossover junction endodeoxyribonuclease RuvC [Candidatus Berkelbacteria bacterium]
MEGKRILGIDPGTTRLGHGLIEIIEGKPSLINHGCIETTPNSPETQKLSHIYEEMVRLVKEIKPDLIAVEMIFFARNSTTAFAVGQARGIVLLVAAQANIPIAEVAPLRLKKILLGNGTAKKKDIQHFIKDYFGLEKIPKPDDAADAIAVALTQFLVPKAL